MGLLSGFAKINDFGVKVLEGGVAPPIQISMDERRRTSVPRREQAPIATSTQHQLDDSATRQGNGEVFRKIRRQTVLSDRTM